MNGILNIYKPEGVSSNYVVQKIKKILKNSKVGHGGTLDPFAQGILPVFINKSTKLDNYMHLLDKEYVACFRLGSATNTGDYKGKIIQKKDVPHISENMIKDVLTNFTGKIQQIPPAFSAKKINGEKAYNLARKGINVPMLPISAYIHSCDLIYYNRSEIFIRVVCGSGTYIRTLCEDIARSFGTVGYTIYLERTRYGALEKSNSVNFDSLFGKSINEITKLLLPSDFLLYDNPIVIIDSSALKKALNGGEISISEVYRKYGSLNENGLVRVYDLHDKFIGVGCFCDHSLKIKSLIH